MSQYLKAKYYPQSDFSSATRGIRPSYIWASILWGRELLLQGIGWRIGMGARIDVWEDNWIPSSTDFKPIVNKSERFPNWKVSQLFSVSSGAWNETVIRHVFHHIDQIRILKTRLTVDTETGIRIWMPHKKGKFSVKSAYSFADKVQNSLHDFPSSSSANRIKKFWHWVWHSKLPPV